MDTPYFSEIKIALNTWINSKYGQKYIADLIEYGGVEDPIDLTSEYFIECEIEVNKYQYTEVGGSYDYGEPEILHLTDLTVYVTDLKVTGEDMTDLTPNYSASQIYELEQIIEKAIYNYK